MRRFIVLGEKEHCFQCQKIIHFADHGTLLKHEAEYLEDWLFLRSRETTFFPMARKILTFEMTPKGRKSVKAFRKLWKHVYVPVIGLDTDVIPDAYLEEGRECQEWVYSTDRLEKERKSGRLQTVMKRGFFVN